MSKPAILDEPQYGFEPYPRTKYEVPNEVRRTSAIRASFFGAISCLIGVLIAVPFMFSPSVTNGQRLVIAAWCLITGGIAAWGYFWNKHYAVLTYEVWAGGPKVQLAPGAHGYYIEPAWLKDAITTFALMWNRNIRVKTDAGKVLEGLTIRIVKDPPLVGVDPEMVSDNEAVLSSGRAIAMTDTGNLIITVWGPRSQDLHGTLEYEFGHPLMARDGFASDMAPGKEREEAWRRERIRLGLLDTKAFRKGK
jgi:hypothetical protein